MTNRKKPPLVGIIMGSRTDWPIAHSAAVVLDRLGISYETKIVSAHRTVERMINYARTARKRGIRVIIALAGGSAHLPGMTAAETILPVIGVPVPSAQNLMNTIAAVFSMLQLPEGTPLATMPVGNPITRGVNGEFPERLSSGAANAAYYAAQILALLDPELAERLEEFRRHQTESVPETVEDAR